MNSVAILAGGLATRFGGRDKSALVVDGRTILERQIAELSSLSDDILLVGGPSHPRTRAVADLIPGCGPLGGVHAALTAARGDAVFVVACDMPYVTAPLGAYLLELAGNADNADRADLVVPRTERGYHPLCAVYTRACLAPITRRLGERRLALKDLVVDGADADLRARIVTVEDINRFGDAHRLFANVNTPAEYAGLKSTGAIQGHERQ